MTALHELIPADELATALDARLVTRKQHPHLPLSIYTYTRTAQYSRAWTTATLRCRGLIVDDTTGEIVAWPFPKFFNVGEHGHGNDYAPPLPDEPFEVYDKVDGSLGIVFHYADGWHVASKGSFTSEQARWAQGWLDEGDTFLLTPGVTYLAEIVYPENRIVVDYGGRHDLVLLAAFDADGREVRLSYAAQDWQNLGTVVRTWPALPLPELVKLTESNSRPDGTPTSGISTEGYVIRYASGLRAKAKLSEYVRLHKVLTGITERDIWRMLGMQKYADQPPKVVAKALGCPADEITALQSSGHDPLAALLDAVPDEFDQWVKSVAARMEEQAAVLAERVTEEYAAIAHLARDRGEFARAVQRIDGQAVRACMFLMLDGRPTGLHLWRAIRPETTAPYVQDDET
ncbi:T4 RnlA family RNA ligase [Streptomyces sp. XY006]|uniref:T4 RnlA family RNA ligase n=1 Tax=Streptomyces sp. XY006 TaxID=2021410 RepID=UPI000B8BFA91|nr:T4 RnlA family RNA ligase [Streptomyces sp. XY006]OXS35424.1 polynucleotide kinase [Streptomyces sp. XY006]